MKGLFNKYHITKADGTPSDPEAEYFILRLDSNQKNKEHLKASLKAIEAYAESIKEVDPELAKDLYNKYLIK